MTTATEPQVTVRVESKREPTPRRVAIDYRPFFDTAKRVVDIAGGSILFVVLSPVFLISATLVAISSPGPIFFKQTRVGRGGKRFTCWKFRTMVCNAEERKGELSAQSHHADPRTFKIKADPRITRFGSWLRRSSMDELPQLINILVGDMSLVGPRPPVPSEVAIYSDRDLRRLAVKPGLTCTWQVSGRADLSFETQVAMDIEYVENRSFWLDLKLLVLTLPALISGKGAY